jgi:hypothetical protein
MFTFNGTSVTRVAENSLNIATPAGLADQFAGQSMMRVDSSTLVYCNVISVASANGQKHIVWFIHVPDNTGFTVCAPVTIYAATSNQDNGKLLPLDHNHILFAATDSRTNLGVLYNT